MKYKFTYKITAFDLWKLSMCYIYGSIVGVCNIIFTIAMLLLTIKFWSDVNNIIKILFITAINLFIVIQPVAIYIRAKRQVAAIVPQNLEIGFDDNGIHIKGKRENSKLKWDSIKGVAKKLNMIIIYTTTKHGYILTDKVLGKQKNEFYYYVVSKIQ